MNKLLTIIAVLVVFMTPALAGAQTKTGFTPTYLIDFVVLNEGKTIEERLEYERKITPVIKKYGAVKDQAYNLHTFIAGPPKEAVQLNIYAMPGPGTLQKVSSDPDYQQHVPFRNEVHNMQALTMYTGEAIANAGQINNQHILVDLVVMNDGYGHPERFEYESKMRDIARKHGATLINSFDIDQKLGGIGPDKALKLNLWALESPEVMVALSSDPAYKALAPYRDQFHDMKNITLYMASPQ